MQNSFIKYFVIVSIFIFNYSFSFAEEDKQENLVENNISDEAVLNYNTEDSLFKKITDLEQEKVLIQLKKEKAQLELDLERVNSEKKKLNIEMENLVNMEEKQKQDLEQEKERLAQEKASLEEEKQRFVSQKNSYSNSNSKVENKVLKRLDDISSIYKLIDIVGVGSELQAKIEDLRTGGQKKVSVGKVVDGFEIKSISLDEGIVFIKNDETQVLNISKN